MSEIKFQVKITATGELRDKDGNLLPSGPLEGQMEITKDQAVQLGFLDPEEK